MRAKHSRWAAWTRRYPAAVVALPLFAASCEPSRGTTRSDRPPYVGTFALRRALALPGARSGELPVATVDTLGDTLTILRGTLTLDPPDALPDGGQGGTYRVEVIVRRTVGGEGPRTTAGRYRVVTWALSARGSRGWDLYFDGCQSMILDARCGLLTTGRWKDQGPLVVGSSLGVATRRTTALDGSPRWTDLPLEWVARQSPGTEPAT